MARGYNNVAFNLNAQRKYEEAQPLFQKALEIHRRLLSDDHPHTASSYHNLGYNLYAQGKYAEAHPLFQKALEIYRRLRRDDHPDIAASTTTSRPTSMRRGSTRKPNLSTTRRWRSVGRSWEKTTRIPAVAT